jgi:hypothetical protein
MEILTCEEMPAGMAVDETGIEGLRVGIKGGSAGRWGTADDHARAAGTISYGILCGVGGGRSGEDGWPRSVPSLGRWRSNLGDCLRLPTIQPV